ncbi:MAG: hypothetical protein KF791_01000 [Verrucomicrobiae bacterium]|nr:hypothetical protein [Verrucomicrobiae bacterium]
MKKPRLVLTAFLSGLLVVAAGCGGIRGSHSVSPASFLIPGLDVHAPRPVPSLPVLQHSPAR